jgi:hypothetical protein
LLSDNIAFMDFLVPCVWYVLREFIFLMKKLDRYISLLNYSLLPLTNTNHWIILYYLDDNLDIHG